MKSNFENRNFKSILKQLVLIYGGLVCLFISDKCFSQPIDPDPCDDVVNVGVDKEPWQSGDLINGSFNGADKAIDGITNSETNFSSTDFGNERNWGIDLGSVHSIKSIYLYFASTSSKEDIYIFISKNNIVNTPLDSLLMNEEIESIYISNSNMNFFSPVNNFEGRYLKVVKAGLGVLSFKEIVIIGGEPEICNNGIDDDCDNLIDCLDPDCYVYAMNANILKHPTCNDCKDGKIQIQISGQNIESILVSIDNGINYFKPGKYLFEVANLGVGDYNIKVKREFALCEDALDSNPVLLRAPIGSPGNGCANGGFETGGQENWTGTGGVNIDGNYIIDMPILSIPGPVDHQILSNGNYFDTRLGKSIQAVEGTYFLRIGDDARSIRAASARYTLTVDQSNKDFNFWFYFVGEDGFGNHIRELNPFFKFRILNSTGLVLRDFPTTFVNPDLKQIQGVSPPLFYQPWTCVELDLNQFLNQSIQIEFIAADCTEAGHLGYVYIDGLCSGPVQPNVEIVSNDVYCPGQKIDISFANDHLYNKYEVYVQRLNGNGSINKEFLLSKKSGSEIDDIIDLISIYKGLDPSYEFYCTDKFKLVVKLFTDCSNKIVDKMIEFSCNGADLAYPDLIICGESQNIVITGMNSCDNCNIEWTAIDGPQGISAPINSFLNDKTIKFPTILGLNYVGAYSFKYEIKATNPDGCVFTDKFEILDYGKLDIEIGSNVTHLCSFDSISRLEYPYPIDFMKFVNINYFIQANYGNYPLSGPVANEQLPVFFIPNQPQISNILKFKPSINRLLRGFDHRINVQLEPKPGIKMVNSGCAKSKELFRTQDSPYFGNILMFVPNAFSPKASEEDNKTIHPYFSKNVYEVWFKVFDRWGERLWTSSIKATNNMALTVDDMETISFDGTFNGQEIEPQVLVFVVDYQNCQVAPADCFDDDEGGINGAGVVAPLLNSLTQVNLPFEKIASGAGLWTWTGSSDPNIKNCVFLNTPPAVPNSLQQYNYCTFPNHKCHEENTHRDEINKL